MYRVALKGVDLINQPLQVHVQTEDRGSISARQRVRNMHNVYAGFLLRVLTEQRNEQVNKHT